MSRISHRVYSKGSARGAGPAVKTGTVRVKSAEENSEFRAQLRGMRWCDADGERLVRCDDCGRLHCNKPQHLAHRCGLEPQVCARCWGGYYTGPGEPEHGCEVRP